MSLAWIEPLEGRCLLSTVLATDGVNGDQSPHPMAASAVSGAEQVAAVVTITSLTASTNAVDAGQSVTLEATVQGADGTIPSGTVVFLRLDQSGWLSVGDRSTREPASAQFLGTASLGSDGTASLVIDSSERTQAYVTGGVFFSGQYPENALMVGPGTHQIVAFFMGRNALMRIGEVNPQFESSWSPPLKVVVRAQVALQADDHEVWGNYGATKTHPPSFGVEIVSAGGDVKYSRGSPQLIIPGKTQSSSAELTVHVPLPPPPTPGIGGSGGGMYGGGVIRIGGGVFGSTGHNENRAGVPTGTIVFQEGETVLGTVVLNSDGAAALTLAAPLSLGSHTITVSYSGDEAFAPATKLIHVTVAPAPTITILSVNKTSVSQGQSFTLKTTVNTAGPDLVAPSGLVKLYDGRRLLAILPLGSSNKTAQLALSPGVHRITARYLGDENFLPSASGEAAVTIVPRYWNEPAPRARVQALDFRKDVAVKLLPSTSSPKPGQKFLVEALVNSRSMAAGDPAGELTLFLDGKRVFAKNLSSKICGARLKLRLTPGKHRLKAVYSGSMIHRAQTTVLTLSVPERNRRSRA